MYNAVMVKIWVKTYKNKKIVKNEIMMYEGKYSEENFDEYVRLACHELDLPTPVILSVHAKNFTQFNISRFKAGDFVETIDFDELTMESCKV